MSKIGATLAEIIQDAVRSGILDINICLPAKIEKYDPAQQKANILPLLKKKYISEDDATNLPVITNVPVQWPSANDGAAFIHLPLSKGDTGIAIFSQRSLDSWLAGTGESVSPDDPRHHDISDAIFIPGVLPFKKALQGIDGNNAIFKNGSMKMEIDPSGKISFEGETKEFLNIIDVVLDHLISAKVTIVGGSSAGDHSFSAATISNLNSDKTDLATIKRI